MTRQVRLITIIVILAALATLVVAASNVQTYPKPSGVSAAPTEEDHILVSWDDDAAPVHRVGWAHDGDARAANAAGDWFEAFHFVDTRRNTDYTVKYLPPGQKYWFIVGAANERFTKATWSEWTSLITPIASAPEPEPASAACSGDDYDRDEWGDYPAPDANATPRWTMESDDVSSRDITLDHHVALKDAHISGGCGWSETKKNQFARDPDNLNPTTRSFSSSKADRTPDQLTGIAASIIDTDGEKCDYATQHDDVKGKYDLTMTQDERATVELWLSLCTATATNEVERFRDPDVNYLLWEIGPDVPQEQYQYLRTGIVGMHRYASDLNLPPLPDDATFYLYHDQELAAQTLAHLEGRSLEDARARFADDGWAGLAGLDPDNEHSGWIMVNLRAYLRFPEPWRYMRTAAHELSHVYQYTHQTHGRFDTTHQEVRVIGPAWMQEGFATFHADRVLAMLGEVTYDESRRRLISQSQRVDVPLKDTETYDGLRAGPGRYDMAAMATELLAAEVGEPVLISFWTLLGPDTPWQLAFETSFGMTIDEFYVLFEEHRRHGFPELDLPDLAPRIPLADTDRRALAALYESAGGSQWTHNGNWLSAEPGNHWHGVTTDRNGHVTALDLANNQLRGQLPVELGDLRYLRELKTELEWLWLGGNSLTGCVPSGLRAVPNNDLDRLTLPDC